jgi:hypothetical protein
MVEMTLNDSGIRDIACAAGRPEHDDEGIKKKPPACPQ